MAAERLAMRKIRDVLRFHFVGGVRSSRKIGRAVGCGKTAVLELLRRAPALGMNSWGDVEALDDEALERLFREAIRRRQQDQLFADADRLAALDLPPLTATEVNAEIEAARKERRADRARRG